VARGWAADSLNPHLRRRTERERLEQEIHLLREEIRIKDVRMEQIPAPRRPHYPPVERLAILELRAARAWSMSQTASRFQVTPATISSWMGRLDEEGPDALVQMRQPVNRFPDFVGYLVRRLKTLCPTMGKARIAQVLARAGLHLGSTTVRRMLNTPSPPTPKRSRGPQRAITASVPNQVWHVDLTTVATAFGFWTPLLPLALLQCWPFCWWLAVIVDTYSRRVMGIAIFRQQPSSAKVQAFLDRAIRRAGCWPRDLINDQGKQFMAKTFKRWCRRHKIRQRFGAIGKHGSLAVVERCIRTIKSECTRRLAVVPFGLQAFKLELALFTAWYNEQRPHTWLGGGTPQEIYQGLRPACRSPRFEPRPRWPRRAGCATPHALIRGRPGVEVGLEVTYLTGRRHLPVVTLKRAA
jgi:putative transposase